MNTQIPDHDTEMRPQITLRRGSIYMTAALYRRYFDGLESVILMRRSTDLAILPVRHTAAGGFLLKLRNSAGDRVVNATDFFTSNRIGDADEADLEVIWNSEIAGLIAANVFKAAN